MKNVYFENVRLYHYPLLMYFLNRKYNVFVFDFDQSIRRKKWLRHLVYGKKVTNISPYVQGNDSLALDNIDQAYRTVMKGSRLIREMVRLYNDDRVELAFKKILARQLSHFYTVQIIIKETSSGNIPLCKTTLIPFKYLETLEILNRCGGFKYDLKDVMVPSWAKVLSVIQRALSKAGHIIRFFLNNVFSLGCVLLKIVVFTKRQKRQYDYAMPITNPGFQFKFKKQRTFDFLLDDIDIRKDNSVFLWLNACDKERMRMLESEGYNILDCRKRNVLCSMEFGLGKKAWDIWEKLFCYGYKSLWAAVFEYDFIIKGSSTLVHTYLFWRVLLHHISMRHFVTFNDEMVRHIGRNILLNQMDAQTWYYVHSNSFEFLYAKDVDGMSRMRYWLWSFLLYDHYISWSQRITDFQKLHHQEVGDYHNTGCLWSTFVTQSDAAEDKRTYLNKHGIGNKDVKESAKIVSFFDTSFFDGAASLYPLKDGIKFYEDIIRLLEDIPGVTVIVKEKKSSKFYCDKFSFQYSQDHKAFMEVVNKLRDLPNCHLAGFGANPADIIRLSDLTVTYAFSSSSVEALAVPQKAIFYDPAERFRDCLYSQIPQLVAHGYEDLRNLVRKLLFEVTDQEYRSYLSGKILREVDNYLDGKALVRFRNLLSNKSFDCAAHEGKSRDVHYSRA